MARKSSPSRPARAAVKKKAPPRVPLGVLPPPRAQTDAMLAALAHASPLAIVCSDLKGLITAWNPAATRMFGWRVEETLGRPMPNFPIERREVYQLEFEQLLRGKTQWVGHSTLRRRKDGTLVEVEVWSAPIYRNRSARSGVMALVADVSDQRRLERALLDSTDREQRRIGQHLHDTLCQRLTGLYFMAGAITRKLQGTGSPAEWEVAALGDSLREAAGDARQIAHGLSPVELDAGGLMTALRDLAVETSAAVPCTFTCEQEVLIADPERALQLFRIAREAVDNAVRHARARHITLSLTDEKEVLCLEILDDGGGFSPSKTAPAVSGLEVMRYRSRAIGGELQIRSRRGQGTRVRCCINGPREVRGTLLQRP